MGVFLGVDVGTVSLKVVVLGDEASHEVLSNSLQRSDLLRRPAQNELSDPKLSKYLLVAEYTRIKGSPVEATYEILNRIFEVIPPETVEGIRVCGSGGGLVGQLLGVNYENDFRAIARGVGEMYPHIRTVLEMGGQNSKFILIERDAETGRVGIADYEKSGDCAAGTGSFIDQQALRLKFKVEDIGEIVTATETSAKVAGRCSVFAKSDMIHAQQKGYSPAEILKGLCDAVARNFKSSVIKGRKLEKPAAFVGGVAANAGVANAMRQTLKLADDEMIVPDCYAWVGAIGAALSERDAMTKSGRPDFETLRRHTGSGDDSFPVSDQLSMEKVLLLRDRVRPRQLNGDGKIVDAYMGVDVGSVSTNVAVIDDDGNMLKEIYTRTEGRPIEIVDRCLKEVEAEIGDHIRIIGVGTTGSGRELIGELVGADTVNDEITAHKTGAEFIAGTMLESQPDTIFEIGGQDSKYISIENGVVVDFTMNEACAAGTGSFLEERAEELGISIKGEFAQLALSSPAPVKLGERCTVFMQQDVAAFQQRGAVKEDLTAGLAYSIVYNYLNRVVRGRKIGDVIFFQGGTAYNDAIAAAFAKVLNKEIIVPPYNGVIGAVGAALLAREKATVLKRQSSFRGFGLENVDYTLREFTCKACSNFCNMQEFTVEGEKTFWGDQCSDKFRRKQVSEKKPVIDDLLSMRRDLLFADYDPEVAGKATIGMPKSMYVFEHFPLWNSFFRELGYRVLLSDETNSKIIRWGIESSVAEPCLPIQAYHGHVRQLLNEDVDWLFVPNMINSETPRPEVNSHYCPWGQTLPFVVRSSSAMAYGADKLICPPLRFRDGRKAVEKELAKYLEPLGEKRKDIGAALEVAYSKQTAFKETLLEAGRDALETLSKTNEIGIVLVGRVYNIYDRGMTLDIGNKLRDYYGVNVIPMDLLPVDEEDITEVNDNMYWNYGRKILGAAKIVGRHPNLHIIYLTNFKCGPDSYIKHFVVNASGKPYLTLQFDGHGNDAGYITRCEAYLDSKGALRWWAKAGRKIDYLRRAHDTEVEEQAV
jgi:predicted CoA-substrate-specific enzyme activase